MINLKNMTNKPIREELREVKDRINRNRKDRIIPRSNWY